MSLKTFTKACDLAEDGGEYISIGGGEPTIHPKFWQMVGIAQGRTPEGPIWLATNGKNKKEALRLANIARHGILSVCLSLDVYHEPIDPEVSKAFERPKKTAFNYGQSDNDFREIRDVSGNIKKCGRAVELPEATEGCRCDELFVVPNGDVFKCGCLTHKIGNVFDKHISSSLYMLEHRGHHYEEEEEKDE